MRIPVVFIALLVVGCGVNVTTERVIPKENQEKAREFILEQMAPLQRMGTRSEDEDYDGFLAQAKRNALELYGRDTIGVWDNKFRPYGLCTAEERAELDKYLPQIKKPS